MTVVAAIALALGLACFVGLLFVLAILAMATSRIEELERAVGDLLRRTPL